MTVIVTLVLEHCFTIARILGSIIGYLVVAFLCYELSDVTSMNTRLVITGVGTVITVLLNLTVTDAARMLGVNRKALSEFVNVKASLSPEMAIRISKATNTSPESGMIIIALESRFD